VDALVCDDSAVGANEELTITSDALPAVLVSSSPVSAR